MGLAESVQAPWVSDTMHCDPKIKVRQFSLCLDWKETPHKGNTVCVVNYAFSSIPQINGRMFCGTIFQKVSPYRLMAYVCII